MKETYPTHQEHYEYPGDNNEQEQPTIEGPAASDMQEIEDYANRHEVDESTPSSLFEDIKLVSEKLDGIETGLGNALGELNELQGTFADFFKDLTALLEELEKYLNLIANTVDPDEKQRLKAELQEKINAFDK